VFFNSYNLNKGYTDDGYKYKMGGNGNFNSTNDAVLSNIGDSEKYKFRFSKDQRVEITLAWYDVDCKGDNPNELCSDSDLILKSPFGVEYYGGAYCFKDGETDPNCTTTDNINTVEKIIIKAPENGVYTLTILAANVGKDIKYSLVVSGIRGAWVKEVTSNSGNIGIDCRAVGLPASKKVNVYAIPNRDMTLSLGDLGDLIETDVGYLIETDVQVNLRGEIARTSLVPVTCVLTGGDYNLLIDVNQNGKYDPKVDMIDFPGDKDGLSFEEIGFTIP